MNQSWLITEPARRTSVTLEIPAGADPDAVLLDYLRQYYPDYAAEWEQVQQDEPLESLQGFVQDATGDTVQLVEKFEVPGGDADKGTAPQA